MARSGPQAIPDVSLHAAYRFESTSGEGGVEAAVFKQLPRQVLWEARIDNTEIATTGETRRESR